MDSPLLDCLPPEVVYRRVPLRDEENALHYWAAAYRLLPREEDWARCEDEEENCDAGECGATCEPSLGYRTESGLERARELLARHHEALKLAAAGLACTEVRTLQAWPDDPTIVVLRDVFRLFDLRVHVAASEQDSPALAEALRACLRMGDMACGASGTTEFIAGVCLRDAAVEAMRRCAALDWCGDAELRAMAEALQASRHLPEQLADALRMELCQESLPTLERLPDDAGLEPLVDAFLNEYYPRAPILREPEDRPGADDPRLVWRRTKILELLQGHPRPFDKRTTARLLGERTAARIRGLFEPAPRRRRWVAAVRGALVRMGLLRPRAAWPAHLAPAFPVNFLGEGPEAAAERSGACSFMDAAMRASIEPPSARELSKCRERLRRVDNPVGRQIAETAGSQSSPYCLRISRSRTALAIAAIGLRRYSLRYGRLPRGLGELSADGFVREVPVDSDGGGPVQYSPRQRMIWTRGSHCGHAATC